MTTAAAAGGAGNLSGALETALQGAQEAQAQTLQFQEGLNQQKQEFQAMTSKLEMEDAMATKMSRLVSSQAQALAQ